MEEQINTAIQAQKHFAVAMYGILLVALFFIIVIYLAIKDKQK